MVVIVIHVWKCIFQKKQILWYIILFNQFYDISDCLKQFLVIINFHSIRNYLEFEAVRSGCMNNVIYDRVNKGYRLEKIHKRGLTTEEITEICKLLLKSQGKDKEEVSEMIEKLIASCVPRSNKKIMEELIDME